LEMPYVRSAGATIHYLTAPEARCPQGMPCVMFVHGGGGSAYVFLQQMPAFAAAGMYAISMSVRGWGASKLDGGNPSSFAVDRFADDVVAVLDACGVERTALVGHSIGGFYVASTAMAHPERVSHAIFSSTFYGLVDQGSSEASGSEDELTPWITTFLDEPYGSAERDACAARLRTALPSMVRAYCEGAVERAGAERARHPSEPRSVSPAFAAARPELAWFMDAMNDGNVQVWDLNLKGQFRVLHDEAATPARLRAVFHGPILLTTTACDQAVHWELLALMAAQLQELDRPDGKTTLHCFDGPLCHAPYLEAPEQYNSVLLQFIRGECCSGSFARAGGGV